MFRFEALLFNNSKICYIQQKLNRLNKNKQKQMENTSQKHNNELDSNSCANDLKDQTKNYTLRKRRSKKKSCIKPIEYPINNRKNGKRVGGWFLCQKDMYLNFLKQNFKNCGEIQTKFYKKLAQAIGSRSFKEVKKFHSQLLYRFNSIQGIIENYNTKMKLQKCKPSQTQKQHNKKSACPEEQANKSLLNQKQKMNYNSIIKIGGNNQSSIQLQKDKTKSQIQEEKNACKSQTQHQQEKVQHSGFKVYERSNQVQCQNVVYPFLNMDHWLQSAPQLWTYLDPRNIILKQSGGGWLFQ